MYRPEYCELARNYCLLGATNEDLGVFFDVTSRTIDNWIATRPEFAFAVREAKALADARVARCLYERAVGYEHTVERTVLHQGREHTLVNKVRLPPDTRACIFWLRNRQPRQWGNRPETPPEDDGIDDIALLEAASEAARHAPIPSDHGQAYASPVALTDSTADEGTSFDEGGDAAPAGDNIALPDAASEAASATPMASLSASGRGEIAGGAGGIRADSAAVLTSAPLPRAPPQASLGKARMSRRS